MKKWRAWLSGSARAEAVSLPVDLTSDAFFNDPAPTYEWLREHHPVAPVKGGGFVLSRYHDVSAALTHPDLGNAPSRFSALNAKNRGKYAAADLASNIPPFLDKPEHVPVRQALSSAFYETFDQAKAWVPECATRRVQACKGRSVDLVADIARPFACEVMARFIGIDAAQEQIKTATGAFFRLFAPVSDAQVFASTNEALQEARDVILQSRTDDQGSLMSVLERSGLSSQAVVDNAYLMLADGIENIEAACAMVFRQLRVGEVDVASPQALEDAVRECLRLSSPAQILPRVARVDTAFQDVGIKAGTPVFLALGSANLDGQVYDDPTSFRLQRTETPLLVFGKGRHSCIGAQLALLQVQSLVRALLDGQAALQAPAQTVVWQSRFGHRWPQSLGVTIA